MAHLAAHRRGPAGDVPLVLLHAFPLDATMWEPVVELLDVPTLCLDLPGFGGSPGSRELAHEHRRRVAPSLDNAAAEGLEALDAEGIERAVVAGLSMGGYVAMAFAERAPDRLAGIGLLNTKAAADTPEAKANRLRVADLAATSAGARAVAPMLDTMVGVTSRERNPEVVSDLRERLAAAPPAGIVFAQRAMADRPDRLGVLAELGRRGLPALVLHGAEDSMMSEELHREMADALDTELVVLPEVGHISALEAPQAVAEALADLHARATA